MYVCLCNAITDSDLEQVADSVTRSVDDAYARLGAKVQCGRCRVTAQGILDKPDSLSVYDPECGLRAAE